MENISHSLMGLLLARIGLDRGDKNTALLLVLAANAPDVDYYALVSDPVRRLEVYRGYSHALVLAPMMALIPIVIVKLGEKIAAVMGARGYTWATLLASLNMTGTAAKRGFATPKAHRAFTFGRFLYLWLCCILAVLSHLLLDWTSVYGIRMLLPFSGDWMHLDLTNAIDPIILCVLLIASITPIIVRAVQSEVGSAQSRRAAPIVSWVALFALCGYEYARDQWHAEVVGLLQEHLYSRQRPDAAAAFPDSFSPFRWRGLVKLKNVFLEVPVTFESGHLVLGLRDSSKEYQAGTSPAIDAAGSTPLFRAFESVNQAPLWRLSPKGDNLEVELVDMRFGTFRYPEFRARALVDPSDQVLRSRMEFNRP